MCRAVGRYEGAPFCATDHPCSSSTPCTSTFHLPTLRHSSLQTPCVSHEYLGALAQNFTVFDHFFHSYFGGSTPGAISVFHGDLPLYNGSTKGCPAANVATFNTTGNTPTADGSLFMIDGSLDAACRMINDVCTPGFGTCASFLPTNQTTIGDVLSAANISWVWYAESMAQAIAQAPAGFPGSLFAYHHHAPFFYQRFANTTKPKFDSPDFQQHIQDETNFFAALQAGTGLPSVSYVRPSPANDMHPAQNNPTLAQAHLKLYFDSIFASTYWQNNQTAILVTFDENGGYWDHVPPYVGDADGPGTRVPSLFVSPFHTHGAPAAGVNAFPYEGLSFLKMLQTRYNLSTHTIAPQRAGTVRDLTNAFAEPAAATVSGDPQFRGFKGQEFQVHGIPGMVYNLLTTDDMLVNSRFALIKDGQSMMWHNMKVVRVNHEKQRLKIIATGAAQNLSNSAPLPITKAWTHTGTYLSEIALRVADTKSGGASLFLRAGGYAFGIQEATINGVAMKLGEENWMTTTIGQVCVTQTSPHTVRLDHPFLTLTFVNSDGFFNLEAGQLLTDAAVAGLGGLLGQTADEAWKASASEEEKENLIFDFLVTEGAEGIHSSDFAKNRFAVSK